MILKILIITLVVCTANVAITAEISDHMEGCYIEEVNDVIPFGTTVNPIGYCYTIHCESSLDSGVAMVSKLGCAGVATLDKNCQLTKTDLSRPYPECCPYFKCD